MSYLELLRRSKARRREANQRDEAKQELPKSLGGVDSTSAVLPVSSADHRRLEGAGYELKLSFGRRVIWERPDTGLYYSEEAALHLLDT